MEKTSSSNRSPGRLFYTNSKGKQVYIRITRHARERFVERWGHIYPDSPLDPATADSKIAEWFSWAKRHETTDRRIRTRLKRHGKDTLYFKHNHFTFIVQDAALLTVEISVRCKRYLNKQEPSPTLTPQRTSPERHCIANENCRQEMTSLKHATAIDAKSENTIQLIPQFFRITGIVLLSDGTKKNVDLGKIEASSSNAEPALLIAKPEFANLIRERVHEKCPNGYLDGVLISLGRKQLKSLFWNIERQRL